MANRTDPAAASIHGTNPQNLVEKILRSKIYQQLYWKEHCFGLSAEGVVDKAVALNTVGGTFGGTRKATDFMCLILKMLQIQPDKDIVIEFIKNEDYKYVRLLGAFYLRLVGRPVEVYQYLEPLYNDYRKVRVRAVEGGFQLSHVDELVDLMLTSDYMFDIALPRLPDRRVLETTGQLDPRQSVLDEEFDEAALEAEAGDAARQAAQLEKEIADDGPRRRSASPDGRERERREEREREKWRLRKGSRRSRSKSPDRRRRGRDREEGDRHRNKHRDRSRERERERGREGRSRRSRSGSPDRRRSSRKERRSSRERGSRRDRGERERGGDDGDLEIEEANALRAKLGLKPLKQ